MTKSKLREAPLPPTDKGVNDARPRARRKLERQLRVPDRKAQPHPPATS